MTSVINKGMMENVIEKAGCHPPPFDQRYTKNIIYKNVLISDQLTILVLE